VPEARSTGTEGETDRLSRTGTEVLNRWSLTSVNFHDVMDKGK